MPSYKTIPASMPERLAVQEREKIAPRVAERLTRDEAKEVARAFGQHLRAGLEGKPVSLATIPTRLHPVDKEKLRVGDEAEVIEVGGTHFRSSFVQLDSGKDPQITTETLVPESKRQYISSEEFFDELVAGMKSLAHEKPPKALGIIWSFPADVMQVEHGIDAISTDRLTKELIIPDINTKPLGEFVVEALRRNGMDIPADIPRAVVNDTAAVLLANGATFGGIVATGCNFAFLHNGQMYNLEAGGFSEVSQNALTQAVDMASEKPGHYAAEKQISGRYVGDAFNLLMHDAGFGDKIYTSKDMSSVLAGDMLADNPEVVKIAQALRDRSAQLVGAMIAGAMREFPGSFPDQEVLIPIDGSFFGKTPGYKEAVEFFASDLLDNAKKVKTEYVQESGMKGAALAALGEVR